MNRNSKLHDKVQKQESESSKKSNGCEESECTGTVIQDQKTGEKYCDTCGLVTDEIIVDSGPEWTNYRDSDPANSNSRVGAPMTPLMHNRGLESTISWNGRDANGNIISSEKRNALSRQRRLNKHAKFQGSQERGLRSGLAELKRMGSALGIPTPIQEISAMIHRQAVDRDLLKGRSIEGVATASLYASCRMEGISRSIEEVVSVSRIEKREICRAHLMLTRELDLKVPPANPKEHVERFAQKVDAPDDIIMEANKILSNVRNTPLENGRKPTVVATSALYAASLKRGELLKQRTMTRELDVSSVTIRNVSKKMLNEDPDLSEYGCDFEEVSVNSIYKILHGEDKTKTYV